MKKKISNSKALLQAAAKVRREKAKQAGAYDGRFSSRILAKTKKQKNRADRREAKVREKNNE